MHLQQAYNMKHIADSAERAVPDHGGDNMQSWTDGEVRYAQGSAAKPYQMKFIGGTYSCSCMAWRNQSKPIDQRTCKHLKKENGDAFEAARIGGAPPPLAVSMSCSVKPVGVDAPQCACHQGGMCDISHDPEACTCVQCRTAQAKTGAESPEDIIAQVMGAKPTMRSPERQETPVPLKGDGIERDKTKRINQHGGMNPFSDREKNVIVAEEEAKKGRKLRQDEKADLFGPPVLLANTVEDDFDPTGWWVSIKKDGLRAYWNGEVFVSRGGNVYSVPVFFTKDLPKVPLDGELYMGRDMLEETNSIVRSQNGGDGWKKIAFVVFDAPAHGGKFEDRLAFLQSLSMPSHVEVLAQHKCGGRAEFEAELDQVTAANEEGLMLRKPGSLYEGRRSSTLLKAKKFFDLEVEVVGYEAGKKANKGKTGGLIVRMDDGKEFNVGTGLTAKERDNPPPIGCRVTISFTTRTKYGIPKCASFVRIRDHED